MKNFTIILSIIIILMSGIISSLAQTITQDEFLDILKNTHPLFQKEELTVRIDRADRESLLGDRDWNFSSSLNYSYQEPAISFFGPEKTHALSAGAGFEKNFWNTGGRFSTTLSMSRIDSDISSTFGVPANYYQNEFGVSYTHPLWRNKGGYLDRLEYDLRQYDIDYADITSIENRERFLAQSAAKFLDWVYLGEEVKVFEERLRLSEEELASTRDKREANLIEEVDVIRAEDAVRVARQNLVLSQGRWKAKQAELAVLIQDDELLGLSPQYDFYEMETLMPLNEAGEIIKSESRLVKPLHIRIDQLERSRLGFKETEKPNLSLVAELKLKNADEDFPDALKMDKPDALVGLQLGFPLENRTARGQVARTELQIAQLEKQRDEIVLELTAALTNLHIQITEMENVLRLNLEQIESARQKTAEELRLYNQGRGDLTFVIQSQDSEQAARLNYAANALGYHKLILEYRSLLDRIL